MLFDAGRYGMIEVDKIIDKGDHQIGVVNADDFYRKISYMNWGKQGCTRVENIPPADMSPEARAERKRKIIETGSMLLARMM